MVLDKKINRLIGLSLLAVMLLSACSKPALDAQSASSQSPNESRQEAKEDLTLNTISANFNHIETYFSHKDTLYFADIDNTGRSKFFSYDLSTNLLNQKDWRNNKRVRKTIILPDNDRLDIEEADQGYTLAHYEAEKRVELSKLVKSENGRYFVRTSPDHSHFYWIEQLSGGKHRFIVYNVVDKKRTEIYTIDIDTMTYQQFMNDIQLSPSGEKFFAKPYIYVSSTGTRQWRLPASYAVWPKQEDVIAYVDEVDQKSVYVFNPSEGSSELIYRDTSGFNSIITDKLRLDDTGRYIAFAVGSYSEGANNLRYNEVHVMDIQGGYHHIENERNASPELLTDLKFSPDGMLLSYMIEKELKVLELSTGQAQSFLPDYLHAGEQYIIYAPETAFYLENNQIMIMDRKLNPKPLYQSKNRIFDFYYSDTYKKMIVLEEGESSHHLKVIELSEQDFNTTLIDLGHF